jgi:uncharacterized protein YndB with AHSA1/START domain
VIDSSGRVVHELWVGLPQQEVFEFFTDPARLVQWIGLSASLEPVAGGVFRFEVQPGQFCEGTYVEVDPPSMVSFSWGWTDPDWHLPPGSSLVTVTLSPDGDGTRVRLVHDRLPGDLRAVHDEGWSSFLARLASVAAGHPPPAYPPKERP